MSGAYWPTEKAARIVGEDLPRPLTPEEAEVAGWLAAKVPFESVRREDGTWEHQPVTRDDAPALPRRVPRLRRRSDDRPLPAAGPIAPLVKHDPAMPAGWQTGLIPLTTTDSTGEDPR